MEIIKIANNDDVIKEASHLGKYFLDMFGEGEIGLFAILDNNEVGFVGIKEGKASFIKKENNTLKHFEFGFEEDFELSYLVSDNIIYVFTSDGVCCNDETGQLSKELSCNKLPELDQDGYNANIRYIQINESKRVNLELHYQADYYGDEDNRPYIYSSRLKNFKYVYLIDYKKWGIHSLPGLGKRYNFYVGYEMEKGSKGFQMFGEDGDESVIRYLRMTHLVNNAYTDSMIPGLGISKDEVCSLISSYGFDTEIPNRLLKMYNEEDPEYLIAKEIIELIKKVLENKEDGKQARMILTNNN